MSLVSYNKPIPHAELATLSPLAIANKGFPYNELPDDRRFEELLYNIYSLRIMDQDFQFFDSISLMSGVRDKGRDCALFSLGKSTGIIQCKKYKTNLTKNVFGEEITKYVLYSLLEPDLLPDPLCFTYYIAVSYGFNKDCSDFIDNFNQLILTEDDLDNWINKHLSQPTLTTLVLEDVHELVKDILSKIKVRKINTQDLDALLIRPEYQHLIGLYFQIRTVTDNSLITALDEKLTLLGDPTLSEEELKEFLSRGSTSLKLESNEFEEIPHSHIERNETGELFNWIQEKTQRDDKNRELNVCLLAGNAGMGKTVILKDLYDKLTDNNIPVLGLKADKLHLTNLSDLREKIGLRIPVVDFIEQCKQNFTKTIILIDQIDALSQSMSSDRNYMEVFKMLIDTFTYDSGVRIVISVRLFDLYYDPSLKIYKNLKKVLVSPLSKDEVVDALYKIDISKEQLSDKLLSLLCIPNHLNIFSRIASEKNNYSITSLQGLYKELWKLKVVSIPHQLPVTTKSLKKLLYKISQKMFTSQQITLDECIFEEDIKELKYLESERLIKRENNQIQFFHQSFYDFVFAKRFVEKKQELVEYIVHEEQSLMIRSAVKMILNYLRDYDKKSYHISLSRLIQDSGILFHIRHLAFSIVLYHDNPTVAEIKLISQATRENIDFDLLFLDNAHAEEWLNVALQQRLLDNIPVMGTDGSPDINKAQYRKSKIVQFLLHHINKGRTSAWEYILQSQDKKLKEDILNNIDDWSCEHAYTLFEQCPKFRENNQFGYYYNMSKIALKNPEYCLQEVKDFIFDETDSAKANGNEHQRHEVLKNLCKTAPHLLFPHLTVRIKEELDKNETKYKPINDDHILTSVDLGDSEHVYGIEFNYWLWVRCLRNTAEAGIPVFKDFADQHITSSSEAVLRAIIYAIRTKEDTYSKIIFDLFLHLCASEHLKGDTYFTLEFRNIFESGFPFMSEEQQQAIINVVKKLKLRQEACVWPWGDKPRAHLNIGECQYALLKRLPKDTIRSDKGLVKLYQELERKYPNYKENFTSGKIIAGMVQRPLPENAYDKMSIQQWLASFRQYTDERDRYGDDFLKGGIREHSWAFREYIKKDPGPDKIAIIEESIKAEDISTTYAALGLMGLTEACYEGPEILRLFKLLLPKITDEYSIDNCIRIASYLVKENPEEYVIDFLIDQALNWKNVKHFDITPGIETSANFLSSKGFQISCGAAAHALLYVDDKKFEEKIFKTIETVLSHGPVQAKAIVFHYYAYLNNLDREYSFALFCRMLMGEDNIYLKASAIWSLQYMGGHNFQALFPIFNDLISSPELGETDSQWLFSILYFSYLFDRPGAEKLVTDLLRTNRYSRSWAIQEILNHLYYNENSLDKSKYLLDQLVKFTSDANDPKPNLTFLRLDNVKIIDIKAFLEFQILSGNFILSDHFLKYLTGQCKDYVFDAINILDLALANKAEDAPHRNFYKNDEITRFIVGAFSSLSSNDSKSRKYRMKLLLSFDTILKDHRYKNTSERILEELT